VLAGVSLSPTCNLAKEVAMRAKSKPKAPHMKVREHRKRLREQGFRPIQIWVPDVRSEVFQAEAHRQSLMVATSSHARKDQAFIEPYRTDPASQSSDDGLSRFGGLSPIGASSSVTGST
jgi:hypothetical protein